MKAVFDTRPDTGYDDDIVRRYHFPNRYLPAAEQCVGDWIVYRETRRGSGRPRKTPGEIRGTLIPIRVVASSEAGWLFADDSIGATIARM